VKPIIDKRGHVWRKIKTLSDVHDYMFHCSYCGLYVYADREDIQNGLALATFKNVNKLGFRGASFLREYGTCDEIVVSQIMSS
jgi:hypothetical protein